MNALFLTLTLTVMALYCITITNICSYIMHMFQLNYYKFDEQHRWFIKNKYRFLNHFTRAILMLIVVLLPCNVNVKALLYIILFAFAIVNSLPKKAKKPLVHTNRVKRMDVTIFVLVACSMFIPLGCLYNMAEHWSWILFVLAIVYMISPALVLIADLINMPIEHFINQYYINDAKKIIKNHPDLSVIGITGSYGKTSVKYYLTTLLRSTFTTLMTPASYNTTMGVVKTVRMELKPTDEIFVCEMGAKWEGDIKEICDVVQPKYGIITSIGPQHLESFGSLDVIKKTKFELANSLPTDGKLFLNGDDENIASYSKNYDAIRYSIRGNGDYNASNIRCSNSGTSFIVTAPDGQSCEYTTRLIGSHNVVNVVGAIAVCHEFGIPLDALKIQVKKLEGAPHRLQLTEKNGVTIIDDAYNSNPSGTKAALEALGLFDGYKILVTPGMVELGEKQFELNKEFGANASEVADYVVLVGKKQAVPIREGLVESGYDERKIFVATDINEALSHVYALNTGSQKKVILLENDLPDNY